MATATQSITILVDNVGASTGYTLATFTCNYDGAGVDTACDGTGYSETTFASATLLAALTSIRGQLPLVRCRPKYAKYLKELLQPSRLTAAIIHNVFPSVRLSGRMGMGHAYVRLCAAPRRR